MTIETWVHSRISKDRIIRARVSAHYLRPERYYAVRVFPFVALGTQVALTSPCSVESSLVLLAEKAEAGRSFRRTHLQLMCHTLTRENDILGLTLVLSDGRTADRDSARPELEQPTSSPMVLLDLSLIHISQIEMCGIPTLAASRDALQPTRPSPVACEVQTRPI